MTCAQGRCMCGKIASRLESVNLFPPPPWMKTTALLKAGTAMLLEGLTSDEAGLFLSPFLLLWSKEQVFPDSCSQLVYCRFFERNRLGTPKIHCFAAWKWVFLLLLDFIWFICLLSDELIKLKFQDVKSGPAWSWTGSCSNLGSARVGPVLIPNLNSEHFPWEDFSGVAVPQNHI